jgi:hypothetical protein
MRESSDLNNRVRRCSTGDRGNRQRLAARLKFSEQLSFEFSVLGLLCGVAEGEVGRGSIE